MSLEMSNRINELRNFQSIISKKILRKFSINHSNSRNGWGWFVDPELDYNYKFNKNKYTTSKHISIPNTIQEYPKIRSIKSINNFHDDLAFEMMDNKTTNTRETNYINIVGIATLVSLIYILIVL